MMEQTNHSTDTLLASFQAGNMAAFSQLYNLHINVLFNYGLKLTLDKELLKDCIHDIFVKLYVKKDELGTIDNLRSYLFISLKNKLCDELRRRMYMSDTAAEEVNAIAPTDVEDDYMEEEQRKIVNCVMRCFSFKLIGRGSASARGCTSTPDERKIATF